MSLHLYSCPFIFYCSYLLIDPDPQLNGEIWRAGVPSTHLCLSSLRFDGCVVKWPFLSTKWTGLSFSFLIRLKDLFVLPVFVCILH